MTVHITRTEQSTTVTLVNASLQPTFFRVNPNTEVTVREVTIGNQAPVLATSFMAERVDPSPAESEPDSVEG